MPGAQKSGGRTKLSPGTEEPLREVCVIATSRAVAISFQQATAAARLNKCC